LHGVSFKKEKKEVKIILLILRYGQENNVNSVLVSTPASFLSYGFESQFGALLTEVFVTADKFWCNGTIISFCILHVIGY
jgi:hypothetical protein